MTGTKNESHHMAYLTRRVSLNFELPRKMLQKLVTDRQTQKGNTVYLRSDEASLSAINMTNQTIQLCYIMIFLAEFKYYMTLQYDIAINTQCTF